MHVQVKHPEGGYVVNVPMLERDRVKGEVAAGEIPYVLRNAVELFELIHVGTAGGWLNDTWLLAIADTAAHSFRARAENEGVALEFLQRALQDAAGQTPKQEDAA